MKVKIQWTYDTTQNGSQPPPPQESIVDLPQYSSQGGDIQVHFYPGHKVKVVISEYSIGHPLYPMSEEDKRPWETRKDLLQDSKEGKIPK